MEYGELKNAMAPFVECGLEKKKCLQGRIFLLKKLIYFEKVKKKAQIDIKKILSIISTMNSINISLNRAELEKKKLPELKAICDEFKLKKQGKKSILVDRIIEYAQQQQQQPEATLTEVTFDSNDDFQIKTWPAFKGWLSKNKITISKQVESFKWQTVDDSEIQEEFFKYDYTKSDLRKDSLVPVPINRTEEFLEMLFDKIGVEWDNPQNEDGEEWDEATLQDFVTHMKSVA